MCQGILEDSSYGRGSPIPTKPELSQGPFMEEVQDPGDTIYGSPASMFQSPHTDDKRKEANESNQVPFGQIYDTFHMHPRN